MTANDLAARLAAVRHLADLAHAEEQRLRALLMDALHEGDRVTGVATTPDGEVSLGSVTRTAPKTRQAAVVVDEAGLAVWAARQVPPVGVDLVPTLAGWRLAELVRHCEETGEELPGVELRTTTTASTVQLRQTAEQKEACADLWAGGLSLAGLAVPELDGGL